STTSTQHVIASREEWLVARRELLRVEKELTNRTDEVARQRQALPWVRIEKEYRFDTDEGAASLKALFKGRSQLIVYHFMYGPDFKAGCSTCSSIADGFNGVVVHLANHDVMFWAISRAPLATLQAYKRRMQWIFPWASSAKNDFNFDFNVSFTEEQQLQGTVEYNFRREGPKTWREHEQGGGDSAEDKLSAMSGVDAATYNRDQPGISTFVVENDVVYHAYSTYARGVDAIWNMYQWLDRAPKGRNESGGPWWQPHDEYGQR
ncbi:MAG TPA: DUF899 domain-containing protein, partial [Steroidobacteraceae bacterium]|nr:DUF899 domain-containing protein [Steroidobacteraceae bacterium]